MISFLEHIEGRDDSRRSQILVGATKVFLAYGFQRTTMDDIARAAEISRPALYILFRNKTDIYRALAAEFIDQVVAMTQQVLNDRSMPFEERIRAATASFTCLLEEIEESPHGIELLDMQNSLASEIIAAGRMRIAVPFTEAIEEEIASTGRDLASLGLSPAGLSDLLLDGLDGMKLRRPGRDIQARLRAEYVRAIALIVSG